MSGDEGAITRVLRQCSAGDEQAKSDLMTLVYAELHQIATRRFRRERPGHTLQPTALVNELYTRILASGDIHWQSRQHFYSVAAVTIRRILVDHARAARAKKRPGSDKQVSLDDVMAFSESRPDDILAVHEALDGLAADDPRAAQVFEKRWFAGFTVEETASILGIAERTVKRDYRLAYDWITRALSASYRPYEH